MLGAFPCASYSTPPARAGAARTLPAHRALRQLVGHLGQPRVCCPPGCALANPGASTIMWHVHPLAPSGQGFPEHARAVERRPFPRPARGRGPQGGPPGPGARLRSGPASHRGCTATRQETRRITHGEPPHRPTRPLIPAAHPGSSNPGGAPYSWPGLDTWLSQEEGGQQAPRPQEARQARGVVSVVYWHPAGG